MKAPLYTLEFARYLYERDLMHGYGSDADGTTKRFADLTQAERAYEYVCKVMMKWDVMEGFTTADAFALLTAAFHPVSTANL